MRKILSLILAIALMATFMLFAMASGEDSETVSQNGGTATGSVATDTELGDYAIEIKSCRLAKSFNDKPIVIVKYAFTNNGENATSFTAAFDEEVYQNGIGLNECYVAADSANYSSDNQLKDIKKGATLDVEVAYELNDTTTDIEVEIKELFSFSDKTITKTFKIS